MNLTKEEYQREVAILLELASLEIKKGDFGKAEAYIESAKQAIQMYRKTPE